MIFTALKVSLAVPCSMVSSEFAYMLSNVAAPCRIVHLKIVEIADRDRVVAAAQSAREAIAEADGAHGETRDRLL